METKKPTYLTWFMMEIAFLIESWLCTGLSGRIKKH